MKKIIASLSMFLGLLTACNVPAINKHQPDSVVLVSKLSEIHRIVTVEKMNRRKMKGGLSVLLSPHVHPDYLSSSFESEYQLDPCGPLDLLSCFENPKSFNVLQKSFTHSNGKVNAACLGLSDDINNKVMAVIFIRHESDWKLAAFHLINPSDIEDSKEKLSDLCWETP